MFAELEWSDILLGEYLLSLFICLFAVIITYTVSKKYNFQVNYNRKTFPVSHSDIKRSEVELNASHTELSKVMKKSPALAAEQVIKANMTKEQQLLECQVRQKQLAQIHELMMKQSDKFGRISLSDVEEQMKLYQ